MVFFPITPGNLTRELAMISTIQGANIVGAALKFRKRKINHHAFTFSIKPLIWSFHVVILQWTAKKCTKVYNIRAEPVFFLLFSARNSR